MRPIQRIIIHCSASPDGRNDTLEDIDSWHKEKGWKMVGYHYVIERDGKKRVGRPEEMIPSQAEGYNTTSIGICLIGTKMFTASQWVSLMELVRELRGRYPKAIVVGHRDLPGVHKDCPGFTVADWVGGKYAALFDHLAVA